MKYLNQLNLKNFIGQCLLQEKPLSSEAVFIREHEFTNTGILKLFNIFLIFKTPTLLFPAL